jgi:hypothetical protein
MTSAAFAGTPIPEQAAAIQNSGNGRVHYLGARTTGSQESVRWSFMTDPGWDVMFPTMPVYVSVLPACSVHDFWLMAVTAVDTENELLMDIKAWETKNQRAIFLGEPNSDSNSDKLDYK